MSKLAGLKLVQVKRPVQLSPVLQRRSKMVARIEEQLQMARAKQAGNSYVPMQMHTIKDEQTGERKTVQIPKRLKEWWFITNEGKLCLNMKYGAKQVEFAKGRNAIELASGDELINTLETLKEIVNSGDLDLQIEAVSKANKSVNKK